MSEPSEFRVLFSFCFHSEMEHHDRALLRSQLGMTTHFHPKHPAVDPPMAFAVLDSASGLFLSPGMNGWKLECRSWGSPPAETIHRWWLRSLHVVDQLGPHTNRPPLGSGPAGPRAA